MKKTIQQKILHIVRTLSRSDKKLGDKELLSAAYLDEGIIDSFSLVEMIATIEQEFGIKFSAGELTSENFRTLGGVIGIVAQNLADKKK